APRPLILRFETPGNDAIQYRSGWRFSLAMTPRQQTGFTIISTTNEPFPTYGDQAAILFQDLDNCPRILQPSCPDIPGDEVFIRFTPDQDLPFIADTEGDAALRDQLATDDSRPIFNYDGMSIPVGPGIQPPTLPATGTTGGAPDGVGYGANDDLPGLVLLSNVGVGRVLTSTLGSPGAVAGFDQLSPVRARNLAGLMTDVAFELRRIPERTVVSTSLLVPPLLFSELVIFDPCVAPSGAPFCEFTDTSGLQRIDGGPIQTATIVKTDAFDFATAQSPNVAEVEVRAVMVAGNAPNFVDDCSGDGRVTARDLVCSGYEVLSNEAVRTFRVGGLFLDCRDSSFSTGPGPFFGPRAGLISVDFDNIFTPGGITCPSGSGRQTTPP
ncbi:MAG: hypothetical protein AAFV29_21595, partial [Myxococcota bacterium]